MKLLAIFDMDGTLIDVYSAWRVAFLEATNEVWGVSVPLPSKYNPGRPSRIIKEDLLKAGISKKDFEANANYFDNTALLLHLEKAVKSYGIKVLPGVENTVRVLYQNGIPMSIVTGSDMTIANLFLKLTGLDRYFITGAYGYDAEEREGVLQKSKERVEEKTGNKYSPESVVVFDDSVAGTEAAKRLEYTTVTIATGISTYEDLLQIDPDYCLENLEYSNSQSLLKEVFGIDTNQ